MQKSRVRDGYSLVEIPTEIVRAFELYRGRGIQYRIINGFLILEHIRGSRDRVCIGCCIECGGRYECEDSCV